MPASIAASADEEPQPTPTEEPTDGDGGGSAGGGVITDRSNPAAPSGLTHSLATVAQVFSDPMALVLAGGLALALLVLVLVAIPAELITSTLGANSGNLGRGFAAIDRAATRVQEWFIRVTHSRALAAAILIVLVSIIFGFSDPDFGFDVTSLRMVLSLAIAYFLLYFVISWLTSLWLERRWHVPSLVQIQPSILLFAVIRVVLSRIVGFTPGVFVGVVFGLELLRQHEKAECCGTPTRDCGSAAFS